MEQRLQDRVTVITGASSGIGAALSRRLAGSPGARLGLVGRDVERLAGIAEACRTLGAEVVTGAVDVRDREALAAWLMAFDADRPIDGVIANAGISAGALPGGHPERGGQIYDVFDVNLTGMLNLVLPMIPRMQARRRGRIVLISSLSAYAPLPDAPAYSASKAAILTFGLALRHSLRRDGIRVNVVCPGFVTTPMSQSFRGWKPFEIGADEAARRIERGLVRDAGTIAFPFPLVPFIPERLIAQAMRLFHL
jgi:NAD(P)-dependent dehydrogenase (short-subunit alcohol dehydrogenase family)